MTFNLLFFIGFSFVSFLIFYSLSQKYSNIFLLSISIVFYLLIDYRHFLLLAVTIVVTFYLTQYASGCAGIKSKIISFIAISIVVLSLVFYKYFSVPNNFNFATDVIMPIGISYFSFKMISYIVDVGLKRNAEKEYSLLEYALYVALFSQIISGPISRISEFEFSKQQNKVSRDEFITDICLIISGVFKKVVIAERLAIYTNYCFNQFEILPTLALWMNMFFYSIQIYCDFCGYSEIAIGITRMFGFKCSDNFRTPYFSLTIKEFWNRWHISLSLWLRDYIYFPLGGSRKGKLKKYVNTVIVFLISGIWHGNTWNYLVWGIWHSIFQIFSPRKEKIKGWIGRKICHIGTFMVVSIGWIFFYYSNIEYACTYIRNMWKTFDFSLNSIIAAVMPFTWDYACFSHLGIVSIMIFTLFLYEWYKNKKKKYDFHFEICFYIVSIVLFGIFGQNSFIYANF